MSGMRDKPMGWPGVIEEAGRLALRDKMMAECRERLSRGVALEESIVPLHDAGLSITESVWVLAHVSVLPLKDLKMLTTAHPIWRSMVEATEPLHDELERAAETPL